MIRYLPKVICPHFLILGDGQRERWLAPGLPYFPEHLCPFSFCCSRPEPSVVFALRFSLQVKISSIALKGRQREQEHGGSG